MILVALSTSTLLEQPQDEVIQSYNFERMLKYSPYRVIRMENIMRNSSSIANAATPEKLRSYMTRYDQYEERITPGTSSTVPGTRPIFIRFNQQTYNLFQDYSYEQYAKGVNKFLSKKQVDTNGTQIAIICHEISPRRLKKYFPKSKLYDGGVDCFDGVKVAKYYSISEQSLSTQKQDVRDWLKSGGILITNAAQFEGAEADIVILVIENMGSCVLSLRSYLTRGVADFCIVAANDRDLSMEAIEKQFDIWYV